MKNILIVEDNEADQFLGSAIIESSGLDVDISFAGDGEEAIDAINKDTQFDLILLDINMPRMNGHEFLEEYSKSHDCEIPVIVMLTSSDQDVDKDQAFKHKCVKDYLVKPITVAKLKEIDALVDKLGKASQ